MFYGAGPLVFKRAEELRKNMTSAENIIWQHIHINEWRLKFRRQHPISKFVVDFYCHPIKLVIEIDGDIYANEEVKKNDKLREKTLRDLGLHVLRFKNEEISMNSNDVLKKLDETIRVLQSPSSGDGGKESLYIIKIGGNIIDDEAKLSSFLKDFASINEKKILVHGGGRLATNLAEKLGVEQKLVDGRRITDAETLKIVTMVYAGYINKNIVARLQSYDCNAIGLCGADGDAILAHKRNHPVIDYGFVGDIDAINTNLLKSLLEQNISIVFASLTHDQKGQLLNTNADTIAQELAKALSSLYEVQLIYSFEKAGVLLDANDDSTVIPTINPSRYEQLKSKQKIFAGMIPKLDNAFAAINYGVKKVTIGKAEQLDKLIKGEAGTNILNE
ncbi:MAG TPA: acetylglutamate kinase [Chitinophagaceae bacterium]|nr:acetylglutamate kinase [Chitinophagaceae bacterium]